MAILRPKVDIDFDLFMARIYIRSGIINKISYENY